MNRASGIIMHIASLPGEYGIGTFGESAYKFADFLSKAGQKYWQILPLGPTSYGDSPYQSFSAFAGNPYFIDFDLLNKEGLLKKSDYENIDFGNNRESIDYGILFKEKMRVLRIAYENSIGKDKEEIEKFREENKLWLEDYALFMAIKEEFNLVSWQKWDEDIKTREKNTLEKYKKKLVKEVDYWIFLQYHFFKEWNNLKKYVKDLGIEFIGDMPIYVAEDSSDVWANPELFLLDENKTPKKVAGCPPDAFSATGQLWGNPIYNWDYLEKTGYEWWIDRVRESLKLYDVVRIDHFRGFESYWEIPYGEDTAVNGKWVKGPGIKLFDAIKEKLGDVKVIAEDLGYLTKEVLDFRDETGFPGMKVLQFAFDSREESDYLPHNYTRNCVAYTGTHDNDTCRGWFETTGSKSDVEYAKKYLKLTKEEGYNWGFIRGVWSSVADTAIALMQDFLNLGNEARINYPSTLGGNWMWRVKEEDLTERLAEKIRDITKLYGRMNNNG
ncbi:4-alpha-glucanotransferase [Clostridium moniliforme]|uniref:4-alpha-glucanotransferase n=1 Tax=Clostridium moniliforme TaxID=39489 RepID=A0ABS4F2C8_9CLOT|nr:4-alpha-glucanotransferase [Clostridium moniliforme]MBP1890394.1 4-alpha-glucanotransferase [Clostridium moniliforme]